MDTLTIERAPLTTLVPDPANARSHGPDNLASIVASLRRFGQAEPLIVQHGTNVVIAGNGRLAAMRELGWTECDVVFLDVDSMDATALGIALNRTADLAGWDDEILAKLLTQLAADDALEGVGFTEEQLGLLLRSLEDEPTLADPGPSEPPENPVSRTGDLWLLGDHRLLCGDSTSPEDMSRLMGDTKASLLATDPPYLVDYQGEGWDGYEGDDAGVAFFRRFLSVALAHCRKDVPIYHWHAHRRQKLVEEAWEAEGLLMHQQIIWAKSRGTLGRSHFMWAHEPCFYGWRQGSMPVKERRPPASETTVWDIGQAGQQDTDHPTQKPLEVFLKPMRFHTLPGEVVLEPFSGSGSQLMAAEQLGRACYAMEMNAAYVDVAVERWQKATGKQAKLESGVSFAEVAAERSQDED